MKSHRRHLLAGIVLALSLACAPASQTPAENAGGGNEGATEVAFNAADGVRVYADYYESHAGRSAPLIMLFHQAGGDARGEYGPIVPRLLEAGYQVLAVDQRAGGDRFGGVNRTVQGRGGAEAGYCEAYPDLVAALDWAIARGLDGPRFAWGSSYSAGLVLKLAAEHGGQLSGVLAFSPASGEPMKDCDPMAVAGEIHVPVLVLRPPDEAKIDRVRAQLDAFEKLGFRIFVAEHGVHGSSMLVPSRVAGDVEPTWETVLAFLREVTEAARSAPQAGG